MPAPPALRLIAILDRGPVDSTLADAALARYAANGVDVTLITPACAEERVRSAARALGVREVVFLDNADTERNVCELVAHIRRLRPQVVLASQADADTALGDVTRAAVARAADPHFGHICASRGPHSVARVEYLAAA